MKAFQNLIIATMAIASPLSYAGVAATFIPVEPSIEAPVQGDTAVSRTARIETSAIAAKDSYTKEDIANLNLSEAEWIFYPTTSNLQLFGGQKNSDQNYNFIDESVTLDFPIANVSFGGADAATMKIEQAGRITLFAENGDQIAKAEVVPTGSHYYTEGNDNAFVALKTYDNGIEVQWSFKNSRGQTEWSNTAQVTILDDSRIFLELSDNEFTDPFFDLSGGRIGCTLALTNSMYTGSSNRNPAEWKLFYSNNDTLKNFSKFGITCKENEAKDGLAILAHNNPVVISPFELPEILSVNASETSHSLTEQEALKPATRYSAQVRHTLTSSTYPDYTNTSAWSAPVNFITEAPDANYELDTPADLSFILNQAKNLTFTLKNNGTETGNPVFVLELPLNVLDNLNGTLSDFYDISSADANCDLSSSGQLTTMTCEAGELEAGKSITINATITVRKADTTEFQYKICEPALCESSAKQKLTISVSDGSNPDNGPQGGESSGSSGGSLFWLLAALPLLRRRG